MTISRRAAGVRPAFERSRSKDKTYRTFPLNPHRLARRARRAAVDVAGGRELDPEAPRCLTERNLHAEPATLLGCVASCWRSRSRAASSRPSPTCGRPKIARGRPTKSDTASDPAAATIAPEGVDARRRLRPRAARTVAKHASAARASGYRRAPALRKRRSRGASNAIKRPSCSGGLRHRAMIPISCRGNG